MGQMGKWAWQCTTTGLDNSIELRTEKIHQAVTEIWVPQVWQPPARPPGLWRQYPSSPEKNLWLNSLWQCHNDGLVQERRNSIANALELCIYCITHRYHFNIIDPRQGWDKFMAITMHWDPMSDDTNHGIFFQMTIQYDIVYILTSRT